jgi:Sec-independent protein secretion pathway component TatC
VTMLIEAVPLILLYELSVLLAKWVGTSPDTAADRDITISEPPPSGAA